MLSLELCQIVDLLVDNDPQIICLFVLCNLGNGESLRHLEYRNDLKLVEKEKQPMLQTSIASKNERKGRNKFLESDSSADGISHAGAIVPTRND